MQFNLGSNQLLLSPVCCSECGTDDSAAEIYSSSYDGQTLWLCDACEQEAPCIWCNVCKTNHYDDVGLDCRHLTWVDDVGEYRGCGTDRSSWESHKPSFFELLEMLGVDVAFALLRSLQAHRYFTQFSGSKFGYERITIYLLDKDWVSLSNYGDRLSVIFKDETKAGRVKIGLAWVISLYSGNYWENYKDNETRTQDADLITASWVEEWLRLKAK